MRTNFKCVLMIGIMMVCMNFLPSVVNAQPVAFGDTGDPDAPLDGGVSLLIAAGVGYGVKKANDNRKKKIIDSN